jgi:hypothetical protein
LKYWLAKVSRDNRVGLIPTDDESRTALKRLAEGECVEVSFNRSRSYQWHKMYKGICREISKNQDPPRSPEDIDYDIRIHAGHYESWFLDGIRCVRAKRIAFDQLDADGWADLWPSLEQAIAEHFGSEYLGLARTGTW